MNVPPWTRWCLWSLEIGGCPFCYVLSVIELVEAYFVLIPPGFLSDFLTFDPGDGFFSTSGVEGLWIPCLTVLFHLSKNFNAIQIQAATMAPTKATSLTGQQLVFQVWRTILRCMKQDRLDNNARKENCLFDNSIYRFLSSATCNVTPSQ